MKDPGRRALHALTAPEDLHLPALAPFENAARRIETNDWLNQDDRAFLVDRLAELQAKYASRISRQCRGETAVSIRQPN